MLATASRITLPSRTAVLPVDKAFAQTNISFMVTITFPSRTIERKALAFLLGRFSGHVLRNGDHLVPEAALAALEGEKIPFSVRGRADHHPVIVPRPGD
jgi:hypothetical protein